MVQQIVFGRFCGQPADRRRLMEAARGTPADISTGSRIRIGMPLAPKGDEDVRQPPPQDPGAVHPGMAAGAERHQLGVVAGLAVMNI